MPVTTDWVSYGNYSGYLARPERVEIALPGVVIIPEIWGVDEHIQDVTRRIAAAGYAAMAPDLYAKGGTRPEVLRAERVSEVRAFMAGLALAVRTNPEAREAELAKLPQPAQSRVGESYRALFAGLGHMDSHLPALKAATHYLRQTCPSSRGQKVSCVGFCMGGGLTALLACEEPELAGAAIFYGMSPPAERVPGIGCPVIGFYAGLDQRIGATLPAFAQAMAAAGKSFESHVYEGAAHSFFNDTGPAYDVRAARDSFARLLDFLRRTSSA